MYKIEYLLENRLIDKYAYLIDNFQLISLDSKALTFIMIIERINDNNHILNMENVAKKMNISKNEINYLYEELKRRHLIRISNKTGFKIETINIYINIEKKLNEKLFKEDLEIEKNNIKKEQKNIIGIFEDEFNRKLSPLEIEQIKEWSSAFSQELILDALKTAVLQNVLTLRYVEVVLNNKMEILNG
jgi:DnaD/phage-associated family protein